MCVRCIKQQIPHPAERRGVRNDGSGSLGLMMSGDEIGLAEPAAGQDAVGVVEDGGLAGGDGALRDVEDDAGVGGV